MINLALDFISNYLETYLESQPGASTNYILLGNISGMGVNGGAALQNKIILSVVNIEEDRISRSSDNYTRIDQQIVYQNPPVFLNLDILFAANYTEYLTSLQLLSNVIKFFQYQNVFTPLNSPNFPQGIEKLIFDMKTLSLQDLNYLWGILGSMYVPSVVYKMRLISISDAFSQGNAPPVTEINVNDKTWNQS
jgi:hypothetical protein